MGSLGARRESCAASSVQGFLIGLNLYQALILESVVFTQLRVELELCRGGWGVGVPGLNACLAVQVVKGGWVRCVSRPVFFLV